MIAHALLMVVASAHGPEFDAVRELIDGAIRVPSVGAARDAEAAARDWVATDPYVKGDVPIVDFGRALEGDPGGQLVEAVARAWYGANEFREALRVYEWLAAGWGDDFAPAAATGSAQCWRMLGETKREIEALEIAVSVAARNDLVGTMDLRMSVSSSVFRLTDLREKRGEWAEALRVWENWKEPRSWCGNGSDEYAHRRLLGIARCRFHLGDIAGSAAAFDEGNVATFDKFIAPAWIQFFRSTGQLDRLPLVYERLLRRMDEPLTRSPREAVRMQVREWQLHDVAVSFQHAGTEGIEWLSKRAESDPSAKAILEAIARFPPRGKP